MYLSQGKSLKTKMATLERKQEEKSREVEFLKQEIATNEQQKEQTDKLIASLQSHLEQESNTVKELTQKVQTLSRLMMIVNVC